MSIQRRPQFNELKDMKDYYNFKENFDKADEIQDDIWGTQHDFKELLKGNIFINLDEKDYKIMQFCMEEVRDQIMTALYAMESPGDESDLEYDEGEFFKSHKFLRELLERYERFI